MFLYQHTINFHYQLGTQAVIKLRRESTDGTRVALATKYARRGNDAAIGVLYMLAAYYTTGAES